MTVSSLIPRNKLLYLSEHRVHKLRDKKLALLSSAHTGWVVLQESDYSELSSWLSKPVEIEKTSINQAATLDVLWNSGLIDTVDNENLSSIVKKNQNIKTLLLKVTGSCNFHCTYCYDFDVDRFKTRLSLERTMAVVFDILDKQDVLDIAFHGGEPLLRFDFIQEVVTLIEERYPVGKSIKYNIQTNGSLFTHEIIDFLEHKKFTIGISIDGISRFSNRLRIGPKGKTSFDVFQSILQDFGDFIRNRCGILAVVTKSSVKEIPQFAVWLQKEGIRSLSLSFMDATGKGVGILEEVPSDKDAVDLYSKLFELIRSGEISKINISSLLSYIDNFFAFVPRDFCNKGPCAASSEFLVLDSENKLRSCDVVYHPFFEIGDAEKNATDSSVIASRRNVNDRHIWLKSSSKSCSTCSIFGLCGGTCVGKAISANGDSNSIDEVGCAIAKFLFPEILEEISQLGLDASPLVSYYKKHKIKTVV